MTQYVWRVQASDAVSFDTGAALGPSDGASTAVAVRAGDGPRDGSGALDCAAKPGWRCVPGGNGTEASCAAVACGGADNNEVLVDGESCAGAPLSAQRSAPLSPHPARPLAHSVFSAPWCRCCCALLDFHPGSAVRHVVTACSRWRHACDASAVCFVHARLDEVLSCGNSWAGYAAATLAGWPLCFWPQLGWQQLGWPSNCHCSQAP